jgi:hypothetical protein
VRRLPRLSKMPARHKYRRSGDGMGCEAVGPVVQGVFSASEHLALEHELALNCHGRSEAAD